MTRLSLVLSIVLVVGLTLGSGVIHGWMSNRWGPTRNTLTAADKLVELPGRVGNWQLQATEEMSDQAVNTLECTGYFVRTYANQETGEVIKVALLLGPSGPISVHTPEICFSSRNHTIRDERQRVAIQAPEGSDEVPGGSDEEFWALTFQSNDLSGGLLRVYYGWSAGGPWSAPEDPRFSFAASPYLYKIQLASSLLPGTNLETDDPCAKFLRDFVPAAKHYLVEPSDD